MSKRLKLRDLRVLLGSFLREYKSSTVFCENKARFSRREPLLVYKIQENWLRAKVATDRYISKKVSLEK